MTPSPAHSEALARFETYAQGQAKYRPGSPGAAAWVELCRLREVEARVAGLERDLMEAREQIDAWQQDAYEHREMRDYG